MNSKKTQLQWPKSALHPSLSLESGDVTTTWYRAVAKMRNGITQGMARVRSNHDASLIYYVC